MRGGQWLLRENRTSPNRVISWPVIGAQWRRHLPSPIHPRRPRIENRTASTSPDVDEPARRDVSFDDPRQSYYEASSVLLDGGGAILMVETVFDTPNSKAALFVVRHGLLRTGQTFR